MPATQKIQVEAALNQGQVSLSTLSSVQRFCRAEDICAAEKFDLVKQTVGKTQRETDRFLATLSPEPFKAEKVRPLSETLTELRITLNADQLAKLQRAKDILSHQTNSWAEVFVVMAEQIIKKSEPKAADLKKPAPPKRAIILSAPGMTSESQPASAPGLAADSHFTPAPGSALRQLDSRYIPRPLKRQKLATAQNQCEYVDPETNRRCSARDHLQIDHIQPLALGGKTTEMNLCVLCRAHNQFQALKSFGPIKMKRHWSIRR